MNTGQPQPSDEELARRAQGGASACFEELVRRYQVPLLRFLAKRTTRRADAEDVLQETFMRAYQSLDKYRDQWPFKSWIFTIAYRLAVSDGRKKHKTELGSPDLALIPIGETPDAALQRAESRTNLWEAARKVLTEEQVTTLWLHYAEDLPAAEVARIMQRSQVGVRTTLHRARRKLLSHLQPRQAWTFPVEISTPAALREGS